MCVLVRVSPDSFLPGNTNSHFEEVGPILVISHIAFALANTEVMPHDLPQSLAYNAIDRGRNALKDICLHCCLSVKNLAKDFINLALEVCQCMMWPPQTVHLTVALAPVPLLADCVSLRYGV